jgi:hypothetical protein
MFGWLARRERRPLWGAFSLIFAAGIAVSVWSAFDARDAATREATTEAKLVAQTELAPMLQTRDLVAPATEERAAQLGSGIESSITSVTPIDGVRLYSSLGRVLYADEPQLVGTRPSYLRDLTFDVANGNATSVVRDGALQTYVPVWLNPNSTVIVAELSQAYGPIVAEATAPWFRYGALAGGLFLLTFGMVLASSRAKARVAPPVQVFQPAPARRATKGQPAPAPDAPLYQHAGFRELEAQRQEAARRAEVAEQNFMGVQQQLKATLTQLKELEGRLAMNETQSSTNDGELQALRDQLKDTAERLHKAELDNNALRERMTLRQQELEEAQRAASEMEGSADTAELRARLTAADERAAELVRQIEKLESELEYTNNKFHMTKLSEALREFDTDEIEIESNDDESFEHPVIIRNQGRTSPQKVR